jgi:hypothetical protein
MQAHPDSGQSVNSLSLGNAGNGVAAVVVDAIAVPLR